MMALLEKIAKNLEGFEFFIGLVTIFFSYIFFATQISYLLTAQHIVSQQRHLPDQW